MHEPHSSGVRRITHFVRDEVVMTIHKKSHIIHKTKSHINTPFLRSFTLKKAQKTSVIFDFVNIQSSRRYFACLGPGTSIILHLRVAYWCNTNKEIFVRVSKSIYLTGIWFHSSGILGASPDGLVDDETALESKCPYTERNLTIEEAVKSKTFCLEKSESGEGYALKRDHVYWDQVQGEMYFSRRKFCYFVIWTTKDVAIVKIERDETWAANIPFLTQFYFDHIFPKIVEGEL